MFSGSVLTKMDVKSLLDSGELIIDPLLDEEQICDVGIDLRLDSRFLVFKKTSATHVDMCSRDLEKILSETCECVEVDPIEGSFVLHPGDFVIAQSFEYVKLPGNIYGLLDGRSSIARLGILVHPTAFSIDPGFEGHISFELVNLGPVPIKLKPLIRVARLVLLELKRPLEKPTTHKYSGSLYPRPSRIFQDEDMKRFCL